jgi:hypothetical protein
MSGFRGCSCDLGALRLLALALVVALGSGCTHALRVQNLAEYQEPLQPGRDLAPPRIGIEPYTGPNEAFFFFKALVDRLGASPAVEQIHTDYVPGQDDAFLPDVVVSIDHRLVYRSSGWNFLIDWPGFAVFMPAWIGYGYHADLETIATLRDTHGVLLGEERIATNYRIRHADMDRTVWAGLGWIPPLYSATALGGGIYAAAEFDDDVIGDFQAEVRQNYSSYVASRLLDEIASHAPVAQRTTGSCFAVDRHGTVLTALDLVRGSSEIRVLLPSGEWQRAQLAQQLQTEDLAVLRLGRVTRGFLPVSSSEAGDGVTVLTLGHPGKVAAGAQPEVQQAEIRSRSGFGATRRLELSVPLDASHVGSPVLNDAGQVLGIVLPSDYEGQPAHAVPIAAARPALDFVSESPGSDAREQGLRRARSALCYVEAKR